MAKRRNKIEIMKDILIVIKDKNGKIKPTHILYKSNLSHQMMELYINEMKSKRFIREEPLSDGKRTFFITDRGIMFLDQYRSINSFMESFGLD